MIRGVLLDLSGVLYIDDGVIPGAEKALQAIHDQHIPVRYITNTTRKTKAMIHRALQSMGFNIDQRDIFTASTAAHDYVKQQGLRPYLLVHPNLQEEYRDIEQTVPNAVLLGDAADEFTYQHLNHAFRLLMDGAAFVAMGDNRYFKEKDGLSLDIGAFLKGLEYASGQQAVVVGKPAKAFFHQACHQLGCEPHEVFMIGDDVHADVIGALDAGLQACLVRTGKYQPGDEALLDNTQAVIADDILDAVTILIPPSA